MIKKALKIKRGAEKKLQSIGKGIRKAAGARAKKIDAKAKKYLRGGGYPG